MVAVANTKRHIELIRITKYIVGLPSWLGLPGGVLSAGVSSGSGLTDFQGAQPALARADPD